MTTVTFTSPGTHTYIVPDSVTHLDITINGAGGGDGGTVDNDHPGGSRGQGGRVTLTLPVTAGEQYTAVVGEAGQSGGGFRTALDAGIGGSGGTGWFSGGDGGNGQEGGGGGGGGATAFLDTDDSLLAVAEGGGGGGGSGSDINTQGGGGGGGGGRGGAGGAGGNNADPGQDGDGTGSGGDGGDGSELDGENGQDGGTDATVTTDSATTGGGNTSDGDITITPLAKATATKATVTATPQASEQTATTGSAVNPTVDATPKLATSDTAFVAQAVNPTAFAIPKTASARTETTATGAKPTVTATPKEPLAYADVPMLDGVPITEDVSQVLRWDEIELELRVDQATLDAIVRSVEANTGKLEQLKTPEGGYRTEDATATASENTFRFAPRYAEAPVVKAQDVLPVTYNDRPAARARWRFSLRDLAGGETGP